MTDMQKVLDGYQSNVQEKTNFDNINKGKSMLSSDDEYIFRLTKTPHVINTQQQKQLKDGSKATIPVDKAVCEFEEQDTKNIITAFFRIDSLNFSEEEAYRSAVIKFFQKIGLPLSEYKAPNWSEKFVTGMRFRGRVVVKQGTDANGNSAVKYYLDVPTVRKLLPTDTPSGSGAPAATTAKPDGSLSNCLFVAKGAKDSNEAMMLLIDAKLPAEVLQAFVAAEKAGNVKYPI